MLYAKGKLTYTESRPDPNFLPPLHPLITAKYMIAHLKENKPHNRLCKFCEVRSSLSSFPVLKSLPTNFATLGDHLVHLLGSASPAWTGCTLLLSPYTWKNDFYEQKELISTVHY